jgi:hypothetical protein
MGSSAKWVERANLVCPFDWSDWSRIGDIQYHAGRAVVDEEDVVAFHEEGSALGEKEGPRLIDIDATTIRLDLTEVGPESEIYDVVGGESVLGREPETLGGVDAATILISPDAVTRAVVGQFIGPRTGYEGDNFQGPARHRGLTKVERQAAGLCHEGVIVLRYRHPGELVAIFAWVNADEMDPQFCWARFG